MNMKMTIKVEFNKANEDLKGFKERYLKFRGHIESLQMKGILPRGEINWLITTIKPLVVISPANDPPDGGQSQSEALLPVLLHHEHQWATDGGPALLHWSGSRLM